MQLYYVLNIKYAQAQKISSHHSHSLKQWFSICVPRKINYNSFISMYLPAIFLSIFGNIWIGVREKICRR